MTSKNLISRVPLLAIVSFVLVFVSSCKKDEVDPAYVGTWVASESYTEDGVTIEMKDQMTFTKNSFVNLAKLKNPLTNVWIDMVGMKGDISVSGDEMQVVINEFGYTAIDLISEMPTGNIVYYKEGDSEFTALLAEMEMTRSFKSEFVITSNKLTLKTDNNEDGDYNDVDETTVYTKQ